MSVSSDSVVTKLVDRVFPRMPDFYGLISAQSAQVCRAMDVFVEFMETGDIEIGNRVRAMEKEGDELKSKHMEILNHAFATPMDREDIYRAIVTIDEILNYAKTAVREIEALEIRPDKHMAEMARLIRDGSEALRDGYDKLSTKPRDAEHYAAVARKAERSTEKLYRAALAELFSATATSPTVRTVWSTPLGCCTTSWCRSPNGHGAHATPGNDCRGRHYRAPPRPSPTRWEGDKERRWRDYRGKEMIHCRPGMWPAFP